MNNKYTEKITFVHSNFMETIQYQSKKSPEDRFSSDLVCCLAVIHHLFISNGYSFKSIFKKLSDYSKKYLVVEFMPKGIWTYGSALKKLPTGYDLDSFKEELTKKFKIIDMTQLGTTI